MRRYRSITSWAAACAAVAAATLLFPSSPTYDPWSWLVWGREIIRLELATDGGPAWKPLTAGIAGLLSPTGDAAPGLWLLVTRTATLLSLVMAWRLGRRVGGIHGAAFASAALFAANGWILNGAWGNSESLLVLMCLGAVELHMGGLRPAAMGLLVAASLVRPEVWPFAFLYGLWRWRERRALRPALAAAAVLVPAAWFLPELAGSGELLRSADRARQIDPGTFAGAASPVLEALRSAISIHAVPVWIGLGGLAWLAAGRAAPPERDRAHAALWIAALGGAWAAVMAAMTAGGFAGANRLLLPTAAAFAVAGGAGWGALAKRAGPCSRPAALLLPAAIVLSAAPGLIDDLDLARSEAELQGGLHAAIGSEGARESLRSCRRVSTERLRVPVSAWELDRPLAEVTASATPARGGVLRYADGSGFPVPQSPPVVRTRGWTIHGCRSIRPGSSDIARIRNTGAAAALRVP